MKAIENKNLYKIIIPVKDYEELRETHVDQLTDIMRSIDAIRREKRKKPLSENYYIVCNSDEPYAKEVLEVILRGEDEMIMKAEDAKIKCSHCGHDSEWSIVAGGTKAKCNYCGSFFIIPKYTEDESQ